MELEGYSVTFFQEHFGGGSFKKIFLQLKMESHQIFLKIN